VLQAADPAGAGYDVGQALGEAGVLADIPDESGGLGGGVEQSVSVIWSHRIDRKLKTWRKLAAAAHVCERAAAAPVPSAHAKRSASHL
jgi:hypothetical protein